MATPTGEPRAMSETTTVAESMLLGLRRATAHAEMAGDELACAACEKAAWLVRMLTALGASIAGDTESADWQVTHSLDVRDFAPCDADYQYERTSRSAFGPAAVDANQELWHRADATPEDGGSE